MAWVLGFKGLWLGVRRSGFQGFRVSGFQCLYPWVLISLQPLSRILSTPIRQPVVVLNLSKSLP